MTSIITGYNIINLLRVCVKIIPLQYLLLKFTSNLCNITDNNPQQ